MKPFGRFPLLWITSAVCLSSLFGQVDASTFRGKYGQPIEEVFELRPGITLTVLYGDNHQVCKMDIQPGRNAASVISTTFVQQLVDEILPQSTRGTPKQQFMSCAGAICWRWAEYEGVTVGQSGGDVRPTPEVQTQNPLAIIQFKSCQASKP